MGNTRERFVVGNWLFTQRSRRAELNRIEDIGRVEDFEPETS